MSVLLQFFALKGLLSFLKLWKVQSSRYRGENTIEMAARLYIYTSYCKKLHYINLKLCSSETDYYLYNMLAF